MKAKLFSSLFLFISIIYYAQVADHVVIAEIYGNGGNSDAVYKYDYVVLYNPTSNSVDLSNWSIQYSPATSYNYTVLQLTGNIQAFSYYLIQLYSSGNTGSDLPTTPDLIGNINLSGTSGKLALVNNTDPISNKEDENVIDFVGYGSTANEYEGSNYAVYPSSNTRSLCRKDNNGGSTYGNGNGWDTNDNRNDFFSNSIPSPLPVELTSFFGTVYKDKVLLKWSTATEMNNYGFQIQRRNIGRFYNWETIGFVEGHGNSNSPKYYYFIDEPKGGNEFAYRLKQIDYDGTSEYSKEIFVKLDLSNNLELFQNYPNPFNPVTKIKYLIPENEEFINKRILIKVYDILGNEVKILKDDFTYPGIYELEFNGSDLSAGFYVISLSIGDKILTRKCMLLK
ncbi:lamin tail domain-containing protein [Rosettibacter firmus]|uniref:lamin tail domain-containing protein n=1 Tax=Rosettibacter firmus TaxID=3111522 RepID=UPI00336C1958